MTRAGTATNAAASAVPLADAAARDRILTDLDTNLLVEAGAGSGKTTSLIGRMLALVERGEPIEHIAAVTFTRKAANELRERFQLRLEQAVAAAEPGSDRAVRYDRALRELDRAFLGTIHAFCGRLLREHPIEAALDPSFGEVTEDDWDELTRTFWNRRLDRAKRTDDPLLAQLAVLGVDPRALFDGFRCVVRYGDVDFPAPETAPPDIAPCRRELEAFLERAAALMPDDEPEDGWDDLMLLVRRLEFRRRMSDWSNPAALCAELERIAAKHCKPVQKRWSTSTEGKKAAKALGEELAALLGGRIADVLRCWREHRYPFVMAFLRHAAAEFERERHATGQLGFEDLLILSAKLLREHPDVRASLGRRYARLLVDEFQDTDPVQAEVCFLLASDPSHGTDWRRVTPRSGSLFLVGDPKQSIYRFRRADIQVYELARSRIAECGATLALTQNFRSVHPIAELVNEHFGRAFPASASDVQAAFTPMRTVHPPSSSTDGVFRYAVRPPADNKAAIASMDSAQVASWIEARVRSGERVAGDFLVLTAVKEHIGVYARALSERNIPVSTTGARLPQEYELCELLLVLHAIADPENAVLVAAALEGVFFGCSPADLYDAKLTGARFVITHAPAEDESLVGRALARLHAWWLVSQRHPADVLVERVIEETGLLAYAASQTLGDARAGALLHLVEALRVASTAGTSGITDATERIRVLLAREADDAPLRPGRSDAVRVMNLHKAKGLEAPVVILAAPVDQGTHEPTVHVARSTGVAATGGMAIWDDERVIAQPPGWDEMAAAESRFAAAERERLLYVAATRAMRELVVSRCERSNKSGPKPDASAWSSLTNVLDSQAHDLELVVTGAAGRRTVEVSATELRARIAAADERTERASVPSVRLRTVREVAKADANETPAERVGSAIGRGTTWGNAVHRCIEAMGRGRDGESLRAFVRAVAAEYGMDAGERSALETLLDTVRASNAWRQLTVAERRHFELPVMTAAREGDAETLVEGVIDAAALGEDGQWLVVDWKTDAVDDEEWARRLRQYEGQVRSYGDILAALSGHAARTSIEHLAD